MYHYLDAESETPPPANTRAIAAAAAEHTFWFADAVGPRRLLRGGEGPSLSVAACSSL
jgi:hypothetical protein